MKRKRDMIKKDPEVIHHRRARLSRPTRKVCDDGTPPAWIFPAPRQRTTSTSTKRITDCCPGLTPRRGSDATDGTIAAEKQKERRERYLAQLFRHTCERRCTTNPGMFLF